MLDQSEDNVAEGQTYQDRYGKNWGIEISLRPQERDFKMEWTSSFNVIDGDAKPSYDHPIAVVGTFPSRTAAFEAGYEAGQKEIDSITC